MHTTIKRRDLLKLLGAGGASLVLPRFARAQTPVSPQYFVLVEMTSGWDVTLGLDPKMHSSVVGSESDQSDMFIEYAPEGILKCGGLLVGPAMQPMLKHAGGFSIVNGLIVSTSDNGHDSALMYMTSGNGAGKTPSVAAEVAGSTKTGSLGLVFNSRAQILDRKLTTTSTSNIESLRSAISYADFGDMITNSPNKDSFTQAQQALLNDSARLNDLNVRLAASGYEKETDFTIRTMRILAAAFASETSYQAQMSISAELDSHSNHEGAHLAAQTGAWNQIATMFDIFKATPVGATGESLFDRTLFMVVSEFSRTPALNASKGKDHNPLTNSALLGGGLVKPDLTFGSSHLITRKQSKSGMPSHTALPVNFETGAVASNRKEAESGGFRYLTPEAIIATVARTQNVDWSRFRSVPESTPYLKSFLKS